MVAGSNRNCAFEDAEGFIAGCVVFAYRVGECGNRPVEIQLLTR